MDEFLNARLCVHQIRMAAHIRKLVPQESRSFAGRESYGVIYKLSGKTQYLFEQDGETLLLIPGSVLYLPQGSSYTAVTLEAGECFAVNFTGTVSLSPDGSRSRPFVCTAASPKLESLFRRLYECLNARLQPDARSEYTALSLLYGIFETICTPLRVTQDGVRRAQAMMQARIADPALRIPELAACADMSLSCFRRVFTEIYGIAPVRYLALLRIAHARKLLAETRLSVSRVAEASGFSDVYYFSRLFTRTTGVSPTAYRRQCEASF